MELASLVHSMIVLKTFRDCNLRASEFWRVASFQGCWSGISCLLLLLWIRLPLGRQRNDTHQP